MRNIPILLAAVGALHAAPTFAQATAFDGGWNVVMSCTPHVGEDDDGDAKGYKQEFSATVVQGRLEGTYGTKDQPGWHFLRGDIKPDGSAALRLDGIVDNPKYAIKDAPRGKPYSYRVKARFEGNSGSGERMTGRACAFTFSR
ncbi:MAG: hypothetical protein ABIR55_10315 [Burkholderiaceae bacterium]